jgi:hypothetical protein
MVRETLTAESRTLGRDQSETLITMSDLGRVLKNEKRYPESEKTLREALEIRVMF